jgi:uncharacterized protein (DUF2164 family)
MKIKTNINGIEVEKEIAIYQALKVLDKEDLVNILMASDTKLIWLHQHLIDHYTDKLVDKYYNELKQQAITEIKTKIEDLRDSIFYTNMQDYLDEEDRELLDKWGAERKRLESVLNEILCESVSSNNK